MIMHCSIDAVVGSASGFPINKDFTPLYLLAVVAGVSTERRCGPGN
jgi:hypothetical protein